ncbi:MAG: transcriptional repressor [Limnochordales bacterium]|nr:transcriptional repressor [Limnochordales bacterium]
MSVVKEERKPRGFIRNTRQRRLILEVLRSTDSHPTADWIYQQVRDKLPNISLGTIYRNLKTLAENGEVLELNFGSTYSRFDGKAEPHYHFLCQKCGRLFDMFEVPVAHELTEEARRVTGWQVLGHRLEFYGICGDCQNSQASASTVSGDNGQRDREREQTD